jgi:hypothetical protein
VTVCQELLLLPFKERGRTWMLLLLLLLSRLLSPA